MAFSGGSSGVAGVGWWSSLGGNAIAVQSLVSTLIDLLLTQCLLFLFGGLLFAVLGRGGLLGLGVLASDIHFPFG